jgi:hypothetical protein
LNPQVHSAPFSLEMVTVVLPDVEPELPPEVVELELQAAAGRPAATRTPVVLRLVLRRLIVVALH